MLENLEARLRGKALTDVVLTGFVDQDDVPARFHSVLHFLYLELDTLLLEMATLGDSGRMRLTFVDIPRSVATEEDMLPAVTSIRQLVLRDTESDNRIARLRLWDASEVDGELVCAAARLDLANGQSIFIDPSYYFGIVLGGREQQELWEKNWPAYSGSQEEIVLSEEGNYGKD